MSDTIMSPAAGDWGMLRKAKPNFFNRRTRQATGADHDHDEVLSEREGIIVAGNARPPNFEIVALQRRRTEALAGLYGYRVYRLQTFSKPEDMLAPKYHIFQQRVSASIDTMSQLRIPYDWDGCISIYRNWIRSKIPFLPQLSTDKEWRVWCTQSGFIALAAAGQHPLDVLGEQPLPSPIHSERLVLAGVLVLIAEWGHWGSKESATAHWKVEVE